MRRALVALALFAAPNLAWAQSLADEADLLFTLGARAYEQGEYEQALARFMESNRIAPNPVAAVNVGHTYAAMRRFPQAYRWYAEGRAMGADPEEIEKLLAALAPSVLLLEVTSDPPGAEVYLNRENLGVQGTTPVLLAVEPGDYQVIVKKDAYRTFVSESLTITKPGTTTPVTATLPIVTGTVKVDGDVGAAVRLGSDTADALCEVPCELELPIGRQLIYYTKPGFRSQPTLVEVEEQKVTAIRTDMVLNTGSVRIETGEPGALVEVDGKPAGFTPTIVTGVPTGRRTVRVSLAGRLPYEVEIEVPKDGQVDLGRVLLAVTTEVQSASRYREDLFSAPASISVISREELDAFHYPTLVDSLRGVRGVHAQQWYGAGALGTIGIRGLVGIPQVDPGQRTRFLWDGLVMETQTNSFGLQSSRMQELSSIEVQRGAGSVLYGTGAISGLVSVYKRGRVDETTVEAEGSTIGREAQGRAFLGVGEQDLGAWVSVNGANNRGMNYTLESIPQTDRSGNAFVGDLQLDDLQPATFMTVESKAWAKDLELRYTYTQQENLLNYGVIVTPLELRNENQSDLHRHVLDLVYKPVLSKAVTLDTRVYAQSHVDDLTLDLGGIKLTRTNVDQWGGAEARAFIDPIRAFDGDTDRRFRISVGSEYHRYPTAENSQSFDVPLFENPPTVGENDMSVLAAYAIADLRPVKYVALSAGGRVDSWNQTKDDFVQFNPRLVGMILPTDDDVLKVIAGRGFRVGDVSERLTETSGVVAAPKPGSVEPESAWSTEAELRHRFDADWSALVSVWQAQVEGLIEQRPDPAQGGLLVSQNAFDGRIRGIDFEVERVLRAGWMVTAWYSRQEPVTRLRLAGGGEGEFEPLGAAPKEQAALKVIAPVQGGTKVATRVMYEGKRRLLGVAGYTDPAVLADVVFTGRFGGEIGTWYAGAYNITQRKWSTPAATSTFLGTSTPDFESMMLRAGLEFVGRLRKAPAAPVPPTPVPEPEPEAPAAPAPASESAQ